GLTPRGALGWGLLEVVPLFPSQVPVDRSVFVPPLSNLKLVEVPNYGIVVLRNAAPSGVLVAPMHLGFFQDAAQNHATSRVLVLDSGETLRVADCFCIQQSQGGLLREAQQRFLVLPLGLRPAALTLRGEEGYSRLWDEIGRFTRRYGVVRG